jgi:hypothetical protein
MSEGLPIPVTRNMGWEENKYLKNTG